MKFPNKTEAIAFILSTTVEDSQKQILIKIIQDHALDNGQCSVEVMGSEYFITGLLFQSEHDVEFSYELDDTVIYVHSLSGVSAATFKKENIMSNVNNTQTTAQQLNEMEKLIAASMQKIMESSMDGILEAALTKQQARIEETVKKTVDEAMKKSVDEAAEKAVKKAMEEAAKVALQAEEAKKAEAVKAAESGMKEGAKENKEAVSTMAKTAAYLAGAAAIATGGYFAWQKWGASSSAPAAQ